MKIKTKELSYDEVKALPRGGHKKPVKQSVLLRSLAANLSRKALKAVHFSCEKIGMEELDRNEPCMVLMNHSSFVDLQIIAKLFSNKPYHIVCTQDGLVGKETIMRRLGCIPTKKFINDVTLVKDMKYTIGTLRESIVMYPEASYSFDGTATPLPESLGKCIKLLKCPVVMIKTRGAFLRDPLYNNLQLRNVNVSAKMEYILSPAKIEKMTIDEINEELKQQFTFDNFKDQQEEGVHISEPFRADGLHRVLYKCPHCMTEGRMKGKGIYLTCEACDMSYELTETGRLVLVGDDPEVRHIPDWYAWERECVRKELLDGTYKLDIDVDIYILKDLKCVYHIGEGHLTHSVDGFVLNGCEGKLHYTQNPRSSYSLYSDFFWYEIGDMICVGDEKEQYYCFPKNGKDVVAKTRMATEELFKIKESESRGQ